MPDFLIPYVGVNDDVKQENEFARDGYDLRKLLFDD
jgi:hypothetical protein